MRFESSVAVLPSLYLPRHGLVLRSALECAALSLARCQSVLFLAGSPGCPGTGGSCCPQPVSCGVPALLSGGLQGLHLHSPSPPCSAPGCWLPQGCCREHGPSPEILQHPAPGAGTRDNAISTRHNTLLPQLPLAIPVPGEGPGQGQGWGPLPSYCSDPSTTHTLLVSSILAPTEQPHGITPVLIRSRTPDQGR